MALQFASFAPSTPASFTDLPTELLVKIILALDWRTLLRLQLVNTELNNIIRTHSAVQYHLELGVAGMVNGPPSAQSPAFNATSDRLARLRQFQSRWKHLERTRETTVRCMRGGIWELAGGVLAQGVASASSDLAGERRETRKLVFTGLPSTTRSGCGKLREWSHAGYEFVIRDFTIDPDQDLLVLLRAHTAGAELHLRSLTTNEKHPRAKVGTLVHKLPGGTGMKTHSLQVCRDRFAVLHKAVDGVVPEELVVYDWKKGKLLFEISFCGIMSFAFLSPQHLLFAVQPFNVMPACHGDHQPRFLICDVDRTAALCPGSASPGSYVAVCEFHLPELKQYADVVDISIRVGPASDPFSSYDDDDNNNNNNGNGRFPTPAFRTAPDNRLFVINLQVETVFDDIGDHRASESLTLGLFVPLSTFLPFMSPPSEQQQQQQQYEIIPANSESTDLHFGDFQARPPRATIAVNWERWMREGARALLVPGAEGVWVCNVFGTRCVVGVERRDEDVPFALRRVAVLEFNGDVVRREGGRKALARVRRVERGGYDVAEAGMGTGTGAYTEKEKEPERENNNNNVVNEPGSTEEEEGRRNSKAVIIEDYLEPSTLEASRCGIFENDVTTGLAYRRIVLKERVRFDGVMMTEDNVIFVHSRHTKGYEVWTF